MKKLLILYLCFQFATVSGQDEKVRLAYQYYQEKDFQKASVLFEELYEITGAQVYFSYAVNCLVEIKDYQQAEKIIKKQMRRNKNDLINYIELGYLLKNKGDEEESLKQYEFVIKNLNPDKNDIFRLANSFMMKREYEFALQTYKKGSKLIKYSFHPEIANVYAFQRKSQEMVDEYLDLLEEEPSQAELVQNNFQARMTSNYDEGLKEIIKKSLIKRIQRSPNEYIFSEMLLWFYLQESDFRSAIIQAKSLDKRLNEGGMRLVELGNMAKSNGSYAEALDAFEYILEKDKESMFYFEAKLGYLEVFSEQIDKGQIADQEDLLKIEKMYLESIVEFGDQPQTIRLIKDLAHLQAFYLNKANDAIKLLLDAIEKSKLDPLTKGACKTELGDIYLLINRVSDAILEYAQAAKLNENNETGDMAKFKRATLAFYTGNFQWAQAQLDVLKTGTSKLIANDAFVLSMLIKDNSGMDSTETALKYFAKAEMLLQQNKQGEALKYLDTLENQFKTHSLIDDVLYLKARIYEKQGNSEKTIYYLEQIAANYSFDLLGDEAIFKLAQIYDFQIDDKKKAMEYYKKIIFDYSGSIYVVDSRKRFRILRGEKIPEPEY